MAQNMANADAILKDDYIGPIIEELNQKTYCLDQLERDSDHIDHTGRRAIVPVHKNRNRGRASIADGGQLPVAGQQQWLDAIVLLRYHTYGIELTDVSIEASQSNDGAFISLLEAETKGVAVDMRKDINRQVFGTGDGLLATCGTTTASTTVVLSGPFDTQYIKIGDTVDIVVKSSGATSTGAVGVTVTGRNVAAGTITVSGSAITTDNTFGVYISGNRNLEMDGLRNITSTARTLHSIDSTAAGNSFWDANRINVGSSITALAVAGESYFEQLADQIGQSGNGDVEVFLTSRGVRRRLADSYSSQKRFNDAQATTVHGGYSAILVNEVPVIADDDCPKGFAFGFNKSALKWFEQVKPGWLQSQGGDIFQLKNAGTGLSSAVWQAWLRWYAALGCVAPNRTGALQFCSDDNPPSNTN